MNRWEGVEAFVAVVRHGSLSAAARELNVSASHVSRLIRFLEQQLDAQLLYRTTRQVSPTEVGRVYFEQCRHLLEGFGAADQLVRDYQGTPKGLLRISCGTVFGERYIAPLLNDFMLQHSQLEIDLHLSNRSVDLISEGFDLAIRMGVLRDSSLVARRLTGRQEYICASTAYFERNPRPHTLQELSGHNCLIGSNDHWKVQVEGKPRELRVRGNWRANSGLAIVDAVQKGLGVAQLPDYYVEPQLRSGEIVAVLREYEIRDGAVWAVYPQSRHLSPKVRQLVDFLQQRFAPGPPWATD